MICINQFNFFTSLIIIKDEEYAVVQLLDWWRLTLSPMGSNPTDLLWGGGIWPPLCKTSGT